ncbi:MBL fold metallo-hydrolase [Halosegnis sp.]|uniref:MBL fold metallo-hydrolase n=1 Tax=Halosegnis sp. TaxID=2864959 RepID=UPI0035D47189
MRVTFLGTGSAMPAGDRNQTGLLVEAGEDTLLVDCGSGVLGALADTEAGYESVETVLLTHHHLDHVSDLLALLKARWLAGEEHLTVVGPDGTSALVEGLLDVHDYLEGRVELTLRDIEPGEFHVSGFDARAVETVHSMYCHAYRFSHPSADGDFCFSGDSEATEAVATLADGARVLAHDCSFPDDIDVSNHPTPSALGEMLTDRAIDRLYLTHLYPHTDGRHREMVESVRESFDGEIRVARDGHQAEM